MTIKRLFIPLVLLITASGLYAQRIVFPGQDHLAPFLNDPSRIGDDDRVSLTGALQVSDSERKQTTQYIFAQLPVYDNIAFGVDFFQDRFDYFSYSTAMLSTAIRFDLGAEDHHLKLGLSGGVESKQQERIPPGQVPDDVDFVPNINGSNREFTFRGGLHYKIRNFMMGGFYNRLPIQRLPLVSGSDPFLAYRIEEGFTAYAQYGVWISTTSRITPIFRYLSYLDDAIYEGALRFDYKNKIRASVSYKNEYSINPALQVYLFDALYVGYSYESALEENVFEDVHALSLSYRFKKRAGEDGPEWEKNARETANKIAEIAPEKKKTPKPKKEEETIVPDKKETPAVAVEEPKKDPVAPVVAKETPKVTETKPETEVAVVPEPKKKRTRTIDRTVDENSKLLKPGYYVVIGSFASMAEAEKAQARFKEKEYYTIIGKKGVDSRYYLIVDTDTDKVEAGKRLRAHQLDRNFSKPWLLTVE